MLFTNPLPISTQQNPSKLYVIGLDSADPNLIENWMEAGYLPCLKSLSQQGSMTRLSSIANGFSDAPWLSFNTGALPGKHGCYNFLEIERETQRIARVGAKSCPLPPFWSLLKNTGKKVCTFDLPKTYPVEGIEGIQISGWGEEYPLVDACSLPHNYISDISSRFGKYRHPRELLNPRLVSQQVRRYHRLMEAIEQKLKAIHYVMGQSQDWDLFMTSFGEAHYANHLFYHLMDNNHWGYDHKLAQILRDALLNIYIKLDRAVETLLGWIPDDANIFILSVHGVSTNYSANHLMDEILERLGFQVSSGQQPSGKNLEPENLSNKFKALVPTPVRDFINDWIVPQSMHDKFHSENFNSSIDWPKTKAFFMPLGHFQGFVSINLKGRDPFGTVDPEEYREICKQIANELKLLINLDTGKPAVKEVVLIHELLQGERLYRLPDLVIIWAEDGLINRVQHPKFDVISGEYYGLRKTQHTGNGFLIAKGKDINPNAQISGARAIDLPPTLLSLMGQPIPDYMEGKNLSELIKEVERNEQMNQISNRS